MSTNLEVWWSVPDWSTIEVGAESDGDFEVRARALSDTNGQTLWSHPDLVPGPATKTVSGGV